MPASIPQLDFNAAKNTATSLHDTLDALLVSWGVPDWFRPYVTGSLGGIMFLVAFPLLFVMQTVIAIGSWAAEQFLELLDTAKKENAGNINDLIAETANELMGTRISGSQLAGGTGGGNGLDNSEALGNALIGIFESALGTDGPILPEVGATNAKKFAGWAINFGMTQGFFSILTEAASIGFLKEFHELPEGLKSALGVGRLQRAALAPLIRNAISQPYDLYLKYKMRPDRLAEGQIVRALKANQLDDTTARQMLAEKGYRDSDIELLIQDLAQKLAAGELFTLVRNGDLTLDQAVTALTDTGMDADNAKLQFKALSEAKADSQYSGILADLESAYVDGFIDSVTYNKQLGALPLSDDEEAAFRMKVGNKQERPRKRVSLAEVQSGIVNLIVDFSYLDAWMTAEGYGPEDQMIITFETLEKIKTAADKERFKEYKANVLRAAHKPVPPWLQ